MVMIYYKEEKQNKAYKGIAQDKVQTIYANLPGASFYRVTLNSLLILSVPCVDQYKVFSTSKIITALILTVFISDLVI